VLDEQGRLAAPPRLLALPGCGRADLLFCPFTAPFHAIPIVPTVSIVHDLQFAAYPQFFSQAEVEERSRHFSQAATLCDRLVCVSDYVAREVQRVTGLDRHRVRFVHNSMVDRLPAVAPDAAAAALARLGLGAGRYLIYPANTWPHKNHAMLITAAGMYFAAHPESDLRIVCTGVSDDPRGRTLRSAVVRMGLADRVLFPGFQDEACFAALITHARALIFPSLFEGFGIPVLEAMASGVPVLSANTTSLPEVAGDAALMFDPRRPRQIVSAIETIESDPTLAGRLAAAGRSRAASLGTAAGMAAGYLEIFAETLAERRRLPGLLRWQVLILRYWLADHPMMAATVRLPGRIRRRLGSLLHDSRYRAHQSMHRVSGLLHHAWHHALYRLREAPDRLFGQVQRARAAVSRRLPILRRMTGRLRRLLSGNRP
jgi:glycosyltransferase involved in cell wall biosynthesis